MIKIWGGVGFKKWRLLSNLPASTSAILDLRDREANAQPKISILEAIDMDWFLKFFLLSRKGPDPGWSLSGQLMTKNLALSLLRRPRPVIQEAADMSFFLVNQDHAVRFPKII